MGTQPLVAGTWERSHCLWPKSDSLQAGARVSTSKGGNGEGEPLADLAGRHGELPPLWPPLARKRVLTEHPWDWHPWVVPLGSSSPWVVRERRGEHPNPCSFLALPLWQARGTRPHLLFPPTQLVFPDGLHLGPTCPTAARARTAKMGASGVTEGHCLEPALLPPTLSGV